MISLAKHALLAAVTGISTMIAITTVYADQPGFRVDNQVFSGDQKTPVSQSTTIFQQGAVYDYLEKPAEILVFEANLDRFVLLNPARRISTEIGGQRVAAFIEELRKNALKRAADKKDPFIAFLFKPDFREQFDPQSGVLALTSPWMSYRVLTFSPADLTTVDRFCQFSSRFAQLSPMLSPQARPPFARMAVNAALTQHQVLPREVSVTMTPKKGFATRSTTIRSVHQWVDQLPQSDLDRVAQTRQFMAIYSPVSLEQYLKAGE
jgi:hypothetical protein